MPSIWKGLEYVVSLYRIECTSSILYQNPVHLSMLFQCVIPTALLNPLPNNPWFSCPLDRSLEDIVGKGDNAGKVTQLFLPYQRA